MPNLCANTCSVTAEAPENTSALFELLRTFAADNSQGHKLDDYDYKTALTPWLHYVNAEEDVDYFSFDSCWSPPLETIKALSERFKVDIEIEYEECGNGVFGKAKYTNGEEIYDLFLTSEEQNLVWQDGECCYKDPEGLEYESDSEHYENKLAEKIPSQY